jgi:hypothetical protein
MLSPSGHLTKNPKKECNSGNISEKRPLLARARSREVVWGSLDHINPMAAVDCDASGTRAGVMPWELRSSISKLPPAIETGSLGREYLPGFLFPMRRCMRWTIYPS